MVQVSDRDDPSKRDRFSRDPDRRQYFSDRLFGTRGDGYNLPDKWSTRDSDRDKDR